MRTTLCPVISEISMDILDRTHHTLSVTPALKGWSHRSGMDNRICQTLCLTGKSIRRH
jgi:hypothetical protein